MYLNIVNNLSFNSKRARTHIKKKNEDKTSIFYGQLTLNWLRVTS